MRCGIARHAVVLESATGTTIWLRDLTETQGISLATVTGFDLSDAQFPENRRLQHGVTTLPLNLFTHNVTLPLPSEYLNRFDLVHQRLLIAGLNAEDWPAAVANLAATLSESVALRLNVRANVAHPQGLGVGCSSLKSHRSSGTLARA